MLGGNIAVLGVEMAMPFRWWWGRDVACGFVYGTEYCVMGKGVAGWRFWVTEGGLLESLDALVLFLDLRLRLV